MSVFVQVTVVPVATVSSGGANARFPSVAAFVGMDTDAVACTGGGAGAGAGAGLGEGVGDGATGGAGLSLQQAAANAIVTVMSARREKNM